ncbi:MAG: DUF2877 domain-containing protein [Candidatus Rokubacteria bacterium]|nr:DUF2877 domain-containing protein [Candidatus Rokubacteria bacterium]
MTAVRVPAGDVGVKASEALARTGGAARVLAVLRESIYLTAGDDIVWLGPQGAPLHARAILTSMDAASRADRPIATGDLIAIDTAGARTWRPEPLLLDGDRATVLIHRARELRERLDAVGPPAGLAVLIGGRTTAHATAPSRLSDASAHRAAPHVRALARACAAGDAFAATGPATALLGLGAGLTPSGDDLVGAMYFARHLLAHASLVDADAWRASASTVVACARTRTHRISAALLHDLATGDGHAPLHDLVAALSRGAAPVPVFDVARRLVRIGHSSGWDMLAGLFIGLGQG